MSTSFHHTGSLTSLDVTLGSLTGISPHSGQDHESYVRIGWGCDSLHMTRTDAHDLWCCLGEALKKK